MNTPHKNTRVALLFKQKGMATLLVSVMLVLLITVGVFATSRSVFTEVKATQNTYWTKRAMQAADGGIDYAIAWLTDTNNAPLWQTNTSYPPYDESGTVVSFNDGTYTVTVKLYRQAASNLIELVSTSQGIDRSAATIRQQIRLLDLLSIGFSNAPLVINGCLSGVTGSPNATQNADGISIETSSTGSCITLGHLGISGTIQMDAFSGSAWRAVFGISQSSVKSFATTAANTTLQSQGGGVYYYDASNPAPNNFHESVGTSSLPAVVVFGQGSGCPKINGGPTIYGIIYYDSSCTGQDQGWGGATINGTVVVDGNITKLTANGQINGTALSNKDFQVPSIPVRILGSWRDF